MKRLTLLLILSTAFFGVQAQNEKPQVYQAHEWGTFTTVQGSDGTYLSGLYKEEEHLPNFVYHHNGFSPDAAVQKGIYKEAANVTVKMETPVVYFYSKDALDVNVRVDFPRGSISQWYPQRTDGETNPVNIDLDFTDSYEGWIEWDAKILEPNSTEQINTNKNDETNTWIRPRETDANLVKCGDEVEKFLFYRGVGNFELPLSLKMPNDQTLLLNNSGDEDISYVFIYEKWPEQNPKVWWTGGLNAGGQKEVQTPETNLTDEALEAAFKEFIKALTEAGLYEKEAKSMLNTWHESYFNSYGIKVFWVVPPKLTDKILPIQLDPKPSELERVLVGRSEILSPSFERQLVTDIYGKEQLNPWTKDRYYLAYQERVLQLIALQDNSANTDYAPDVYDIFPNPTNDGVWIDLLEDRSYSSYQLVSTNGTIVKEEQITPKQFLFFIKLEGIKPGTYYLHLVGHDDLDPLPVVVL